MLLHMCILWVLTYDSHIWVVIYGLCKYSCMSILWLIYEFHMLAELLIYESSYVWYSYMSIDICWHMIVLVSTHIWVFADSYMSSICVRKSSYMSRHMSDPHIWVSTYDNSYMRTRIWLFKSSYVCQTYDSHMTRAQRSYVWHIWSYVAVYDSQTYDDLFVYDTHIWVCRHMTLIYESISQWDG